MDVTPLTLEGMHVRLEPMRVEHYERLAEIGLGQDIFRYFPIAIDMKEQMLGYVHGDSHGRDQRGEGDAGDAGAAVLT